MFAIWIAQTPFSKIPSNPKGPSKTTKINVNNKTYTNHKVNEITASSGCCMPRWSSGCWRTQSRPPRGPTSPSWWRNRRQAWQDFRGKNYIKSRKDTMLTIPPDWQGVFNPWNPASSSPGRHQACFCHSLPGRTLGIRHWHQCSVMQQ